jgi:hypothetical protein
VIFYSLSKGGAYKGIDRKLVGIYGWDAVSNVLSRPLQFDNIYYRPTQNESQLGNEKIQIGRAHV